MNETILENIREAITSETFQDRKEDLDNGKKGTVKGTDSNFK
jgi:hypothetical protein